LIGIFADPKVVVRYMSDAGEVADGAPEKRGFAPIAPRPDVLKPLEKVADEMWPGAPVLPDMETGASDSIYTMAAGLPTYGISGVAIDQEDLRMHGKDERVRVSSYYEGVDFFYRYLKALGR
jgi:acetylornithine deacetylase/succinyl-diaminopimelate desuccinylase-like protein